MIKVLVCHRPDGLEVFVAAQIVFAVVCHRPDGLEERLCCLGKA